MIWPLIVLSLLLVTLALTNVMLKNDVDVREQEIKALETRFEEVCGAKDPKYGWPISLGDYWGPTSPFGERTSPWGGGVTPHKGVDLLGAWQARIVAAEDGEVVEHWLPPGVYYGKVYSGHSIYGGMIRIRHDDGNETLYAHLSSTFVHERTRVLRGQMIGRQGSTGMSQAEHLHFEVLIGGESVNPLLWIGDPLATAPGREGRKQEREIGRPYGRP